MLNQKKTANKLYYILFENSSLAERKTIRKQSSQLSSHENVWWEKLEYSWGILWN